MFTAQLLLPMEGRPARITRSPRLPAARQLVEIVPAARHAGDLHLPLEQLLDVVERGLEQLANTREALPDPLVGDGENARLGLIEDLGRILAARVALLLDLGRGLDELPQDRLRVHDPDVLLEVRGRGCVLHHLRQELRAAHRLEVAAFLQLLGHGDEVRRHGLVVERDQRLEQLRVRVR
jgi:hypothetical protein